MGGPVAVRGLQLVTDVAIRRERQSLLGHHRAADVAAQPFQLLTFIRARRHAGMQGEPGYLADLAFYLNGRSPPCRLRLVTSELGDTSAFDYIHVLIDAIKIKRLFAARRPADDHHGIVIRA